VPLNSDYKLIDASKESGASIFRVDEQDKMNDQKAELGPSFDPENGGNNFLRNDGKLYQITRSHSQKII
jgi:hypothetical protein